MSDILKSVFVTGSAGFIGYHLSLELIRQGYDVIGIDSLNEYYDLSLKLNRNKILQKYQNFTFYEMNLNNMKSLKKIFQKHRPNYIFHLAAQAGVRYSIENPREYLNSNINGTYNIVELVQHQQIEHLLFASTSSVYGSNVNLPFKEKDKADEQMSFYASTKKSCEVILHSFSHIYKIPITAFRFFTVYGPWGRPDMALFKFTRSILNDESIDVYNYGKMERDFTYIDDLIHAIVSLKNKAPDITENLNKDISSIAPFRVINIGNGEAVNLMRFINLIEKKLKKRAKINFLGLQKGDVPKTLSDTKILDELIGKNRKKTNIEDGINNFVDWYLKYYHKDH